MRCQEKNRRRFSTFAIIYQAGKIASVQNTATNDIPVTKLE
jgi:hypothetical protein